MASSGYFSIMCTRHSTIGRLRMSDCAFATSSYVRHYVMLCLFIFQRLINGYLASGLTMHENGTRLMLRRLTELRVMLCYAEPSHRTPPLRSSRRASVALQHYPPGMRWQSERGAGDPHFKPLHVWSLEVLRVCVCTSQGARVRVRPRL